MAPASTFNSHPVSFRFSPTDGLKVTPGPDEPPSVLATADLICLRPADVDGEYTLFHQISGNELVQTPITRPPPTLLAHLLLRTLPEHLSAAEVTVLISTVACNGTAGAFHANILAPLLAALGVPARAVHTTSPTSIAEAVGALAHARAQTLLLLSGDTSIHEALNAPLPSTLTLAVFPHGTGNALANSYLRGAAPLRALLFGAARPLPLIAASFPPGSVWQRSRAPCNASVLGAVVASWGFHASLVADTELLRGNDAHVGTDRFRAAAEQNLAPPLHAYRGRVSVRASGATEWTPLERNEHFYVLATLCASLEATFCISPASVRGEQALRVVHFGMPTNGAEDVMGIMTAAYAGGKHVEDERVGYEQAGAVAIEIQEADEQWRRVCVDGGIVVIPEGGRVEIEVATAVAAAIFSSADRGSGSLGSVSKR